MEERGKNKVVLLAVLLILIIIITAVMGYYIYTLIEKNATAEKEIVSLNSKISELENIVNNYQKKIDSISNTLNSDKISANSSQDTNSSSSNYIEITSELGKDELLQISDTIDNSDGTYTIKGKIIVADWANQQAEYPPYKENGEYKKITISASTKYVYDNGDEDILKNIISSTDHKIGPAVTFSFENGKCVSINETATGH